MLLHEWTYDTEKRPQLQLVGELGELFYDKEPTEDVTTWVYDEGCYTPIAKLINGERYSIVSDYIGRPVHCFDDNGEMVWETDYDVYGRLKKLNGEKHFIPFRQMGQYEDAELGGVYYNRFRYYDSGSGVYISQDPIGLHSGQLNFYAYVKDCNSLVDVFGLECGRKLKPLGRGSTGRTVPANLNEQLAMKEIMSNPDAGKILIKKMRDASGRWDGWSKMSNKTAHGVEIHFNALREDSIIKAIDDFKFIGKK